MIGIYKITSPSGRVYIGQSTNIELRFKTYKSLAKTQRKLNRSFLKYGIENHIFEIVCECKKEDLNALERYYQDVYNCVRNGLNCLAVNSDTLSGYMSKETRKLMSKNHKKIWLGKKHSKNTKEKISETIKNNYKNGFKPKHNHLGEKNPMAKSVLDLNTGVFYHTIKEASFYMGFSENSIKDVLNEKVKKSKIKVI